MSKTLTPILVMIVAVLAVALFLRGGEILYAIVSTNSSAATVNLTNSPPTIENVSCSDDGTGSADTTMDLLGGTYDTVLCSGVVNDANGVADFNTIAPKGVFFLYPYKTTTTCRSNSGSSNVDCYVNNTCMWKQNKNTTANFVECAFKVWFNAGNTTPAETLWYGHINVTDGANNLISSNDSIEMAELLAVGVDSVLPFGSKSAGVNDTTVGTGCGTAPNCRDNISNYGNMRFDIRVNGTSMTCVGGTGGSILPAYLHVNLSDSASYNWSYALTGTAADSATQLSAFDLAPNITATSETPTSTNKPTWWGIGIPIAVGGNCESVIWFTAVSG